MAEIRYGLVEGGGKGKEVPLAATQYFHRRGGKFVTLNTAGNAEAVTTGTVVAGWLEVPKHTSGQDTWVSSGTAKADHAFMIYADPDNVFELPASSTRTLSASALLGSARLVTTGATTSIRQQAQWITTAASISTDAVLTIVDMDLTNNTVKVKVKPKNKQAK